MNVWRWLAALGLGLLLVACGQLGAGSSTADVKDRTILVAGASGRVGRYVVDELRRGGYRFRPLTRNKAEAVKRLGSDYADLDWIECDVRDPAQVAAAVQGVDYVISVIGANEVGGANSAEFVDYGGVKNLVDAARGAGVRQFVLLTAIGVTDPAHPFNKATKGALQWRLKGEESLRRSGVPYTIVRPGGLVNTPAGQAGVRFEQGDNWRPLLRSTLSRGDLAQVLIAALGNPDALRTTFEVVNDPAMPAGAWRQAFAGLVPDPD